MSQLSVNVYYLPRLCLCSLLLFIPPDARSDETDTCPEPKTLPSSIRSDTTLDDWINDPDCVDYLIGRTSIKNALLTIAPGVRLAVKNKRSIVLRGDNAGLQAIGTADKPIVITSQSQARGSWGALWFDGSQHPQNHLEHVTIEYGGKARVSGSITQGGVLLTGNARVAMRHVTVRQSASWGLSMAGDATLTESGNNTFTDNANGPVYLNASQVHLLDSSSRGSGNDSNLVGVRANEITTAVTWLPFADGYFIERGSQAYGFSVKGPEGKLTLREGVTLHFAQDSGFTVHDGGVLEAVGSNSDPVVLTGSEATPGWWRGVRIFSSATAQQLKHTVIEYAGGKTHSGEVEAHNLLLGNGATLRMQDTVIRHSAGYGMVTQANASLPDFENNSLTSNAFAAAYLTADTVANLSPASSYTGNGRDSIEVHAYTHRIDKDTQWHDLGVPYIILATPNGLYVDDSQFTLAPGTRMLFDGGNGLSVKNGQLIAKGSDSAPIVLAGKDSSWKGVLLANSQAELAHVTFEKAGAGGWGQKPAALTLSSSDDAASHADLGPGTRQTGAEFGLRFEPGDNTASGCERLAPVSVPSQSNVERHCAGAGTSAEDVASTEAPPVTGTKPQISPDKPPVQAQQLCSMLNFENINGEAATDDMLISDQFWQSHGIRFSLENGESPRLAEVGGVTTAFEPDDMPAPNQNIGDFFLTDDGILTSVQQPSPLIITFAQPMSLVSGIVMDVDYRETFTIQALDSAGALLHELVISAGDANTGDSIATPWQIKRTTADISSMRFVGVRPSGRFGLAFDNFKACP